MELWDWHTLYCLPPSALSLPFLAFIKWPLFHSPLWHQLFLGHLHSPELLCGTFTATAVFDGKAMSEDTIWNQLSTVKRFSFFFTLTCHIHWMLFQWRCGEIHTWGPTSVRDGRPSTDLSDATQDDLFPAQRWEAVSYSLFNFSKTCFCSLLQNHTYSYNLYDFILNLETRMRPSNPENFSPTRLQITESPSCLAIGKSGPGADHLQGFVSGFAPGDVWFSWLGRAGWAPMLRLGQLCPGCVLLPFVMANEPSKDSTGLFWEVNFFF